MNTSIKRGIFLAILAAALILMVIGAFLSSGDKPLLRRVSAGKRSF